MSEVYNKTTEINKMNNQTIINQYNQYEDNDNNQNNNCIYNSDESIPIGPENNKNPFIKPTVIDKELYMSSNSSSTSHNNNNSVIQIEQDVLQHTESETSSDEGSGGGKGSRGGKGSKGSGGDEGSGGS